MFSWQDKYHWIFSDAGPTIPDQGPAITGAKIFRGGHFKNVVRETIQNSLDAKDPKLPEDVPVRVVYELMYLERNDVPGSEDLSKVIDLCYEYISSLEDVKLDDIEVLREANDRLLKKERIPVLRISDYNTVGLNSKNYTSLMKNEGLTTKTDEDSAGSFGFGKFAPYLLSPVNAILYGSLTENKNFRFIGRAFFSTFRAEGKKKMGNTLFGELSPGLDETIPIKVADDVPAVFRRGENGTDLYILCFDRTEDWKEQTAISILENFFYAIWQNKLTVILKEGDQVIEFNHENIGDRIEEYDVVYHEKFESEEDSFKFTAPMFWNVIKKSVPDGPIVFQDFRGKGEILLYLYMGDDIDGKACLRMRNSGMKIEITTRYDGLPSFNAVFVATGTGKKDKDYSGNISKFLRELESPAHDNWAIENITKPAIKHEADLVLKSIHKWIRDEVRKRVPKDDGTPIDIFGLNRILPNVVEEGNEQIEENAVFSFVPIPVDSKEAGGKKKDKPIKKDVNGRGKKPDPNPKPRPEPPEEDEEPKKRRNNHQREKIVATPLSIKGIRTPFMPDKKCYRVSVIPEADASVMLLKIRISGDDSAMFDTEVIGAQSGSRRYTVKDGYIHIPSVKAETRYSCDVTLSDMGSYALEVRAYAKK